MVVLQVRECHSCSCAYFWLFVYWRFSCDISSNNSDHDDDDDDDDNDDND